MTDSPNLLHRKNTHDKIHFNLRRSSEFQASPFRYTSNYLAMRKAMLAATIPIYNLNFKNVKSLVFKSMLIMIF